MNIERKEHLREELRQIEKMMLTATRTEAEMLYARKQQIERELEPRPYVKRAA